MHLKLGGEGEASPNDGPPGDLYIEIHVEPHEFFERSGNDIISRIPISFVQAALGATIDVPTLYGSEKVSIAEEPSRAIQYGCLEKVFLRSRDENTATKSLSLTFAHPLT